MNDPKELFKPETEFDASAIGTVRVSTNPAVAQRLVRPLAKQEEAELDANLSDLVSSLRSTEVVLQATVDQPRVKSSKPSPVPETTQQVEHMEQSIEDDD